MSFEAYAALTIHDVKNRLASLAGRAEARGDEETVREALDAAARLTALLVCYKAENGWLGADIDGHPPADLVVDLAAESARLFAQPVEPLPGAPQEICFYDDNLVRLALHNALHNAQRHARARVCIGAALDGDWLDFTVSDDGPGYPADLLTARARPAELSDQGTGLGLHLARLVAALHTHGERRGAVLLANDGGARFTLRLPR